MFASFAFAQGLLADSAALAAVALVGYLFVRRSRRASRGAPDVALLIELARAQSVAKDLCQITQRVLSETVSHVRAAQAFQRRLGEMQSGATEAGWQQLRDQADLLLGPTLKLTTTLSLTCDELRRQQSHMLTFAAARVDPETGLHNRRSMTEHLDALLTAHAEGDCRLALGLFSTPVSSDDPAEAAKQLKMIARLLEHCVRGNDVVARYSRDEFAVIMPKTPLTGAMVFGDRLMRLFEVDMNCPLWGGIAEAAPAESLDKLLSRADSALYSARTNESACLYQHTGNSVRRHQIGEAGPIAVASETAVSTRCQVETLA